MSKEHKLLDLGCGAGKITEHLFHKTKAHVTGLDYANEAIKAAQKRNTHNKDIEFIVGNMDDLEFPTSSFDIILAIDTLYFASNMSYTIRAIRQCLRPRGKFAAFWSQICQENDSTPNLSPQTTDLAKALADNGFHYETIDQTQHEIKMWKRSIELMIQLKDDFEAEGHIGICLSRLREGKEHLKKYETRRMARYRYIAWQ